MTSLALRIQPYFSPKICTHLSNSSSTPLVIHNHKLRNSRISCSNSFSDASLASEFAAKVAKINSDLFQTEEAMNKSREILFGEVCEYLGLKADEAKHKWRNMDEDEKWALVKAFLSEWAANFHPLSARSAKEMVEEYLRDHKSSSSPNLPSSASGIFPGLKRILGFS